MRSAPGLLHIWIFLTVVCAVYAIICEPDEYDAGYSTCLKKQKGLNSLTCPLDVANPPPQGRATCQYGNGASGWSYINIGGTTLLWVPGEAKCLLTTYPYIAPPDGSCQGGSMAMCLSILYNAGCASAPGNSVCHMTHGSSKHLPGYVTATYTNVSVTNCCMKCHVTAGCQSINYASATKTCELNSSQDPSLLVTNINNDWYQLY